MSDLTDLAASLIKGDPDETVPLEVIAAMADAAIIDGWRPPNPRHPHSGPMTEGGHWWVDIPLPQAPHPWDKITICKYCGWVLAFLQGAWPVKCAGEWESHA